MWSSIRSSSNASWPPAGPTAKWVGVANVRSSLASRRVSARRSASAAWRAVGAKAAAGLSSLSSARRASSRSSSVRVDASAAATAR